MKILFVYPGYIVREVPLNLLYISGAVKARGHETRLFHLAPYKTQSWLEKTADNIAKGFRDTLNGFTPDVVAFSVMIQDYDTTRKLSHIARREYDLPVIWGGIQPILQPEECLGEPDVDFICTGEGETVFPELIDCLEAGTDPLTITGIWGKTPGGQMVKNGRPDLIADLDDLAFPDRELLEPAYYQAELTGANILTARGCPFPCAFCQNKRLMEIYKGKGKFVRYRSFENIFSEMEKVITDYNTPSFYFSDEIFTLNQKRAIEFCQAYKTRINKPFMVQTRVDHMNPAIARALSDAGCFMVNMAIESGNDHLRNQILNKNISKKQIMSAYLTAQEHGLMTSSFNMIGVPGETEQTIRETIALNTAFKPDRVLCSIFMPLPGTALWDYCLERDLLVNNLFKTTNYYSQSVLKQSQISQRTLIGYQGFFDWYILLPREVHKLVDVLRLIYQSIVPTDIPRNYFLKKVREKIIETVYQLKRFLPQKTFHVKTR